MGFHEDILLYWAEYNDCDWDFYPDSPLGVITLRDKVVAARCNKMASADRLNGLLIWILFLATSRRN